MSNPLSKIYGKCLLPNNLDAVTVYESLIDPDAPGEDGVHPIVCAQCHKELTNGMLFTRSYDDSNGRVGKHQKARKTLYFCQGCRPFKR